MDAEMKHLINGKLIGNYSDNCLIISSKNATCSLVPDSQMLRFKLLFGNKDI